MKVYTDTSVFGGCFDQEFKVWSEKYFKEVDLKLWIDQPMNFQGKAELNETISNSYPKIKWILSNQAIDSISRGKLDAILVSADYLIKLSKENSYKLKSSNDYQNSTTLNNSKKTV